MIPDSEFEFEEEFEGEFEEEYEYEANPLRRVYADAMMEHLGHAASTAESEAEAEAFLGALIPMAARIIPRVAPAIMRAAPALVRGVSQVGRSLLRTPAPRPLVRAVPTIVRRTAANLAGQVAQGRPITAQGAVRTLARQTQRTLSNPRAVMQAVQRNKKADRRFHQTQRAQRNRPIQRRPAAATAAAGRCTCR
jgi:hypothetical protein